MDLKKPKCYINPQLSEFMNLARWVSASLVVITHVNNRMLIKLSQLRDPSFIEYVWGFICGFAHQAVVIFFTLSGFLVGGKVLREIKIFNARNYIIDRIVRIYLVFIPALIITAILDKLGSGLLKTIYQDILSDNTLFSSTWLNIVGNLLNLQGILVPGMGSNGPLSTLANEFWYYLTFPLLVAPLMPLPPIKRFGLCIIGVMILTGQTFLQPSHGVGFILWLTGALSAVVNSSRFFSNPLITASTFLVLVLVLRLGIREYQFTFLIRSITDILVSLCFSALLYSLRFRPWNYNFSSVNAIFAGFSYSLYAVHVPVIMFYCAVIKSMTGFGWHDRPDKWWEYLCILGAIITVVAFAYMFSIVTERYTTRVRNLTRKFMHNEK